MTERDEAIGGQAVQWVVRMGSDQRTRADEEAFRAWLEQDPAHRQAFADCRALWDAFGDLAASDEAHENFKALRAPHGAHRRFSRRGAIAGGLGAAVVAAASVVGIGVLSEEQTFRTAPGEQKRVRLADGSGVLLNTDTVLRVKFIAAERRLFLDRGQAFFQVAKDQTRPFRVFAGRAEVRALGTAFEVRRIGDSVQVTLEEGKVAIYRSGRVSLQDIGAPPVAAGASESRPSQSMTRPAAVLIPGEQAVVARAEPLAVSQVDLRKIQAWRYGRMILDDVALGDAVADLNRYGGEQILLADPKLAAIRVSGVFHTGRPDDFVESVTAAFPVDIKSQDETTIVLKSR